MRCKHCGIEIEDGAKFCRYCGKELSAPVAPKRTKIWIAVAVAAVVVVAGGTFCLLNLQKDDSAAQDDVAAMAEQPGAEEQTKAAEQTEATEQSETTEQTSEAVNTADGAVPPAFVEYNVKGQFMELGKTYDYVTCCANDTSKKTTGHLTVTKCETLAPDVTHAAKDGYEWKTVEMQAVFDDENARMYSVSVGNCNEDYYDIVGNDNTMIYDDKGVCTFTIHWNGEDYTECTQIMDDEWDWESNSWTYTVTYEVLLPISYDGRIYGMYDASIEWESGDGRHIYDVADDNTLFFRVQ